MTYAVVATLTERREGGMQKWERTELPASDRSRYIWLAPHQTKPCLSVGAVETIEFVKGTDGVVGGHWSGWRIAR